jgi:hypothetical protein
MLTAAEKCSMYYIICEIVSQSSSVSKQIVRIDSKANAYSSLIYRSTVTAVRGPLTFFQTKIETSESPFQNLKHMSR